MRLPEIKKGRYVIWQHKLTDVDAEGMTGTCVICGPVKLIERSNKQFACENWENRETREVDVAWHRMCLHIERLRRRKGTLTFDDYWKVFRLYYNNEFADAPGERDNDPSTWQLKEVFDRVYGEAGRGLARRRDRENKP